MNVLQKSTTYISTHVFMPSQILLVAMVIFHPIRMGYVINKREMIDSSKCNDF